MAGRKPLGPALVEHLDGSTSAKERLELILATIAGQVTVVRAAEQLGISEAMFYKLRQRVLQVSLTDLEPKPLGRPPQVPSEAAAQSEVLATKVTDLERQLAAQTVRLELAQILPQVVQSAESAAGKKTAQRLRRKQRERRRRRRAR